MARAARAAGKDDRPNLIFDGNVHVVWEKFCRYCDVQPQIMPSRTTSTIQPDDVRGASRREHVGVAAVLGTTFTGQADDIPGINDLLAASRTSRVGTSAARRCGEWRLRLAVPVPGFRVGFRLSHVRSINVSGHKFGPGVPGIGWLIFREGDDLSEDLVFYENYLGKPDATFTLNFSTRSSMVRSTTTTSASGTRATPTSSR